MVEHVYKYVWYIFARTIIGDTPKPDLRFFPGRLGWTIFAQGTLRRFTQRPWFEHPTSQLRAGHSTTELDSSRKWTTWRKSRISIMNWSRLSADHDYERNRKNNGWKMTFMLAKHPNLQQPPHPLLPALWGNRYRDGACTERSVVGVTSGGQELLRTSGSMGVTPVIGVGFL